MPPTRFNDGEAYERGMAVWSQLVGHRFLDWLAPDTALKWLDVGCGNGAFTEILAQRCAPAELQGLDPSEPQLMFARGRPGTRGAIFRQGDAMALPFADAAFDAAAMALVIFFVPDPAQGVAGMARVVRPGGLVCAYVWDVLGGGFPVEAIRAELRGVGAEPFVPPGAWASRMAALQALWTDAGLERIETMEIAVERSFDDFEAFWNASMRVAGLGALIAGRPAGDAQVVKDRVRRAMPPDASGRVTSHARANAIKGHVPG